MINTGTAVMTTDNKAVASTPKSAAQPENGGDARSFSEILENVGSVARGVEKGEPAVMPLLRRADLPLGGNIDLQEGVGLEEDRQQSALLSQAGPVDLPLFTGLQSAGQMTPLLVAAPASPSAALSPAVTPRATLVSKVQLSAPGRTGWDDTPAIGIPPNGTAQRGASEFPLPDKLVPLPAKELATRKPNPLVGATASVQSAVAPTGTSICSARIETHILAADGSAPATRQYLVEAPSGQVGSEGEPIAVQITGQVVGAWASMRGTISNNSAENPVQIAAGNSPLDTAPDVVKTVRFDLHPGELGEVHVRLSMIRNELRLQLSFSADRAASIAQADRDTIKQALSDGGMNLNQLVIDVGTALRPIPQMQQDGSASNAAPSGEAMPDGSEAGRERSTQQDDARRKPMHEGVLADTGIRTEERTGIFI